VVGHSIGATQALRFLEAAEARSTVKGCLLISPPWMIKDDRFRGFFLSVLDFDVLMWKASRFAIIHSKDDDVIPFDHAEKYARVLHARLVEGAEGDKHFQGEKYLVILEEVLKIVDEEIIYEPGMALEDDYSELHER
jgi:predicted alpha/beta hydrolase family esterase